MAGEGSVSALTKTTIGSQYSDVDRRKVLAEYAVHGNQVKVASITGIPRKTISDWVNSEWGQELISRIRHENQDEFITQYENIIRKNLTAQEERLDKGDIVGVDKDGKEVRQSIRYRDLVIGGGIAIDKLRLLCN